MGLIRYGDPDINLLMENQAFSATPGSVNPHYFLTSTEMPGDLRSSLRKNRNLKTLTYDKVDDDHSGLKTAIQNLLDQVEDARADLRENGNW